MVKKALLDLQTLSKVDQATTYIPYFIGWAKPMRDIVNAGSMTLTGVCSMFLIFYFFPSDQAVH